MGGGIPAPLRQVARWVLVRTGAYELADRLCDFATFGEWAIGARDPLFLQQLPRVRSREDRLLLLEQHRCWAAGAEAAAASAMIVPSPVRRPGRLRLGLVSSDFYAHPMALFTLPLFEHRDERFELFAYSFRRGASDPVQERLASLSNFRHRPDLNTRDSAELIAADDLDLLIDLNGITNGDSVRILAHRPARKLASWLGYPHSTGLAAIDYIVVDPQLVNELLLEQPLVMPRSWIALPPTKYNDADPIDPRLPEERNGFLTFGTLNNPYKFTPECISAWGRIVAACPRSRFLFARPEADAPSFQRVMIKRFAAEGVTEDRLLFGDGSGGHMAQYNRIDVSLDSFPLTGGTTTCDSLWMGVPVVSLVGEALFERLSYSLLVSAGLPELAALTVEDYQATAVSLAADRARRAVLRSTLRDQLKASPLGRTEDFCRDFYHLMAEAIQED